MRSIVLQAPAKVNLFLKVLNKRSDGYHNIKTLFERVDLCDQLRFSESFSGRITIHCTHPQVPKGPKNLIYRAACLLKERCHVTKGADIFLTKRIPVAAGLAGGSSDGAATLLGLNKLWKLGLNRKQLLSLADRLGSDVAFFLHNVRWGLGTGRGNKIRPVDIPQKYWHILVIPRIKMYSREVFTRLNLELTKTRDNVSILTRYLNKKDLFNVEKLLSNDLESSILRICPRLKFARDKLQAHHGGHVIFSGSGPAVFGLTLTRKKAVDVQKSLLKRYSQVFVVQSL